MESKQPAVRAHGLDDFEADASLHRPVFDALEKGSNGKGLKLTPARLAGFERSFVFKSRFIPLALSRFLARIR